MANLSGRTRFGSSWPTITTLFILCSCQWCSSDFNVVIPEICHLPQSVKVNLSWVHEMVQLGMRDEAAGIQLNIAGPEEICDRSEGLLKFISMAYADPAGTMIASLEPNLCPTAATFCQLRQQPIISWTCPEGPDVLSLKPSKAEVIVGIQRLINYFNWKKVAFAKSRSDGSPFCDELGVQLQEVYYNEMLNSEGKDNVSVVILGNYEDLSQLQVYSSIANSIDSLLLCVSYGYGFTDRLFGNEEERMWMKSPPPMSGQGWTARPPNNAFGRIPLVILPEWPLPMEFFSPEVSTLALLTNAHPFPPSSYDFEVKSWEVLSSGDTYGSSSTPYNKMIETLLAQMILKSLKIGLELDRSQRDSTSHGPHYFTSSSSSNSGESEGRHSGSSPTSTPAEARTQSHNQHLPLNSGMSFYFSLAQYEQGRWHPLINLPNGDKSMGRSKNTASERESFTKNQHHKNTDTASASAFSLVTGLQILVAAVATTLIVLAIIAISLYVRTRFRNQLYGSTARRKFSRRHRSQGPYKIILTSNDVVFGSLGVGLGAETHHAKKASRSPFGFGNRSNATSRPEEKPDLLKVQHGGLRKNSSVANMVKADPQCLPGGNKARYKGDLVHLRNIGASAESLQLKMKTMAVLETLHGLRHENITAMLGCLTESRPALVWEYCSRGSLYDIIQQNDIKLDWAFKLSLLTDLVRGMRHLHLSLVKVHGNLSSKNCVVDARWVLKITDYGLSGLYQAQGLSPSRRSCKELLWTAPELLRDETLRRQGTQAGDIYSFAIIIQEVLVRGEPFCMLTLSTAEILEKLKHPPPLIRPSVSKGVAPPEAINIMRQCWAELPDMRPDFMVIHDLFKTLNHGRKANIVDTMFQMLEKYSNNLEELIRERTEQLDLEKKKTEQLLNRMLPSTVAEKLKLGLPVDPEEFSEVTIYFSDIVGFTTISAYSTPFEVVDLLNDLYTCFDATINDYNVYKVETIGDAYMVVGGAPVWSRDHADQIATMALDLLHQSGKFRIRHLPYTPLRLRIGLHTGPCCAGVVGLTMPRYCLFGDTVNTASRMESTGSAWRIHISGETKAKLDSIGGYVIQYRGMTDIKGKGQMPTFWLLGKEGFDKELPKPPGPNDSCYLDEKSIMYGRTGIMPDTSTPAGNEFADPSSPTSTQQRITPKAVPKYGLLSGGAEPLRSLSPAEQVAHQLLNGKPTARGLRRQFSLDQGSNISPSISKSSFRKAPSLEETSEYLLSTTSSTERSDPDSHQSYGIKPPRSRSPGNRGNNNVFEESQTQETPSSTSGIPEGDGTQLVRQSSASRSLPKPRTLSVLEESPTLGRKHMIKATSLKEEPDKQYEFQ